MIEIKITKAEYDLFVENVKIQAIKTHIAGGEKIYDFRDKSFCTVSLFKPVAVVCCQNLVVVLYGC
jgi:hypothetical protein